MAKTGILTTEMPAVLGSDSCAVIVETGEGCERLTKGDYVYGMSRLGQNAYSPFQETFLVDEDFLFKKTDNVTPEQAAIIGAGLLVSSYSDECDFSNRTELPRLQPLELSLADKSPSPSLAQLSASVKSGLWCLEEVVPLASMPYRYVYHSKIDLNSLWEAGTNLRLQSPRFFFSIQRSGMTFLLLLATQLIMHRSQLTLAQLKQSTDTQQLRNRSPRSGPSLVAAFLLYLIAVLLAM